MPRPRIGTFDLAHGGRVTLRPACPQDGGRVQDYVRSLSLPSRYNRFFGPVSELSSGELERMTHNEDGRLTLIAETKVAGTRKVIGEARGAVAADRLSYELAVSVDDGWHGRGLGSLLLRQLECHARSLGVPKLVGDVLHSNAAMRKLAHKTGFGTTRVPADARLVRIVKDISGPQVGVPCARPMTSGLPIAA